MSRTRTARQHGDASHDTGGPLRSAVATVARWSVAWHCSPPLATVAVAATAVAGRWAVGRYGLPTPADPAATDVPAEPDPDPR